MPRTVPASVLAALAAPALAAAAAAPAPAQVPVVSPTPIAEYGEPFSQVVGVRELRDGRVIVADARDRTLQVVDLTKGTAAALGRAGSGPGEWGIPGRLLPLPGDSTLMPDLLNGRYLLIGPGGRGLGTWAPAADREPAGPPGPGGPRIAVGGPTVNVRATDAQGRIYHEGPPIVIGPDGTPKGADSVPVLRSVRGGSRQDTLAWINLPRNNATVQSSGSGSNRNVAVRIGGNTPFSGRDEWAALPDGRVAVVRHTDYRVEVFGAGAPARGAPVRYTPVRIGDAEKAEWRDQQRNATRIAVTSENGVVRRQVGGGPGAPPFPEPSEWPAVKPPFVGQNAVLAAPTGEVWVARTAPAAATDALYDVFDATGRHVRQVRFPARTTVVGFGAGAVYAVTRDADDLQYLRKYGVR